AAIRLDTPPRIGFHRVRGRPESNRNASAGLTVRRTISSPTNRQGIAMTKSDLNAPQFTKEPAAIAHLEASRWPDGATCPHCGSTNVHRMQGKTQAGYFLCNDCRDKFTGRTGTVMERSHIPV